MIGIVWFCQMIAGGRDVADVGDVLGFQGDGAGVGGCCATGKKMAVSDVSAGIQDDGWLIGI